MLHRLPSVRGATLVALAVLLVLTFLRVGREVPAKNELLYLVRLAETYDAGPLAADFTLGDAQEHFAFNHVAGLLTLVLPLEAVGWVGRIVSWAAALALLLALGRRLGTGTFGAVVAIGIWVGAGQSLVADSWMLGTFEAKSFAYPLLLAALLLVIDGRIAFGGLLAGLSATFHPSVGLFGAIGCGAAALVPVASGARASLGTLVRFGALTFAGALPAVLALLPSLAAGSDATASDWAQAVRVDQPYHLDPFTFSRGRMLLLVVQLGALVALAWRSESTAWRRAAGFVAGTGAAFFGGLALRAAGAYELLATFPFRLFPLFTPLVFLLGLAYLANALVAGRDPGVARAHRAWLALGAAIGLVMLPDPVSPYVGTILARAFPTDEPPEAVAAAFRWVDENLPADARGLVPPEVDRHAFHRMRRPLAVTAEYPVYAHIGEWHARLRAVGGEVPAGLSTTDRREHLDAYFDEIPEATMREILERYDVDFLISTADYALPVAFARERYRVYLAPAASDTSGSEPDAS